MLSQVPERRNVALADFYRRPPSKRKHPNDEPDIVSWADNSSLPSLGMVRTSLLAEEFSVAWEQLVCSVRSYFQRCLHRQSSGSTAGAQLFPNADRLRQLLADVVLPLSKPLAPIEVWASSPPPTNLDIFTPANKDGLRPRQEMGFISAVRKGFQVEKDDELSHVVDWCLFDAIFTPFADQVGDRLGRLVSSSLTYPTGSLLTVLALWLQSLAAHQDKQLATHHLLKKIVEMIEDDFCFCMPKAIPSFEALPNLSSDFAVVFMNGYIEQRPLLPYYLWSSSGTSPIPLPALAFLEAFVSWIKSTPSMALQWPTEHLHQPSIYSARWAKQTSSNGRFPTVPMLGLASWCITCPIAELCCKEGKSPLLPKAMPNPFDFSNTSTESASLEETLALRLNAALDWQKCGNSLAELHSQLLLALSLHQAQVGSSSERGNSEHQVDELPANYFLQLAKDLSSAASWLTKQDCHFDDALQLAGDRLGQILQVALSARLLSISSDMLNEISSCFPSNKLLEVILECHHQT